MLELCRKVKIFICNILRWPEDDRKSIKMNQLEYPIFWNFTNLACFLQRSNYLYRSNLHVSNFLNFRLLEFRSNWNFFPILFIPNYSFLNSLHHDWVFHQNNSSCTQWHSPRASFLTFLSLPCCDAELIAWWASWCGQIGVLEHFDFFGS